MQQGCFFHYSISNSMTNWAQIFTGLLFYAHCMVGYTKWEYWSLTITRWVHGRRSEHTDRNVEFKPKVLFRTTPIHYRKPFYKLPDVFSSAYYLVDELNVLTSVCTPSQDPCTCCSRCLVQTFAQNPFKFGLELEILKPASNGDDKVGKI